MKRFVIVCFLFFLGACFIYAQNANRYLYLSPLPNSNLVSKNTNIIIRYGEKIDRQSIVNQKGIVISGNKSGRHNYDLVLSDNNETLVLNMPDAFEPGETVNVVFNTDIQTTAGYKIPGINFSFQISPLKEPVKNAVIDESGEISFNTISAKISPVPSATDSLPSDFPVIKVRNVNNPSPGYTLMAMTANNSGIGYYLMMIDNEGKPYWYRKNDNYLQTDFKMQANGMLSFAEVREAYTYAGGGKSVHKLMDTSYAVIDSFTTGNGYITDSHDFKLLPNGHAILISYDLQPVDMSLIVPGGNPGAYVAGSIIQELDAEKNVVFQWRSWDHIDISESYFNLTLAAFDPIHANGLDVDDDGNILVSFRNISQVIKINRTTGDMMWRLGGVKNQFTFINEHQENAPLYFSRPHDIRSLSNGRITLFDNGLDHKPAYSRAVEYIIDEQNKTATLAWEYKHPDKVYGATQGSAQRLPNGNTIIGWGSASGTNSGWPAATEVTPSGEIVFELLFETKGLISYRALKYPWKMDTDVAEVTIPEIWAGNDYVFNKEGDSTFTSMRLDEFDGSLYNYAKVKYVQHAPVNPLFTEQAPVVLNKRIVVSSDLTDIKGELSFDALKFAGQYNPAEIIVYQRETEGQGVFVQAGTLYNNITKQINVQITSLGEFIFCIPSTGTAAKIPLLLSPGDSSSVNQNLPVKLSWTPVGYTNSFHLQVADNLNFNNLIVDTDTLKNSSFIFSNVNQNSAYYWRVKSGNSYGESDWSDTFLFNTTEPFITVVSPNGGEKIQRGLQFYIKWNENIEEGVILDLEKNGTSYGIIDTIAAGGVYNWSLNPSLPVGTDYKIIIRSLTDNSLFDISDSNFEIIDTTISSAVKESGKYPIDYSLEQNYPNPFNPATRINYSVANAGVVTLRIYDILGRQVAELVNGYKDAGSYSITFNASEFSSGVYFYRINCNSFTNTKRMLLAK